MSRLVHIWLVL